MDSSSVATYPMKYKYPNGAFGKFFLLISLSMNTDGYIMIYDFSQLIICLPDFISLLACRLSKFINGINTDVAYHGWTL